MALHPNPADTLAEEPRAFDCFVSPPSLLPDLPPESAVEGSAADLATVAAVRLLEQMTRQNLVWWETMVGAMAAADRERA